MKYCPKCNTILDASAFYKSSVRKDKLSCWCKSCDREKKNVAKLRDPEKFRQRGQRSRRRAAEMAVNPPADWIAAREAVKQVGAVRVCSKCKTEKPTAEFPRCSTNKDGLYSHCKSCVCAASAEFYARLSKPEKESRRVRNAPATAAYRKRRPDRVREVQRWAAIKHKYGLTKKQFFLMLEAQNGKCALCESPIFLKGPKRRSTINIDHCHLTGAVRALLCNWCNSNLGRFKDSPKLLRQAASYLEKYANTKTNTIQENDYENEH